MPHTRYPTPDTRRRLLRAGVPVLIAGAIAAALLAPPRTRVAGPIPDRLADTTFWRMISEMSEPNGYFQSDNFVSNETQFQHVIPGLAGRIKPGGVYLGVGPDQNFTYIVAFKPSIAFIVDIRRQNAMEHLMYKALIELSADRADFLSMLFGRPRPAGLDTASTASALLAAYAAVPTDDAMVERTIAVMETHLLETHGFPLDDGDIASIEFVYGAFIESGPALTYSSSQRGGGGGRGGRGGLGFGRRMPTYADLMQADDGEGVERSYLASEREYRALKDFESRNLLVPVVGNFAGDKALRAVGQWVREHGATVDVFYLSNVEQYLFQQGDNWSRFYKSVATLPINSSSTFIRSVSVRQSSRAAGAPFPMAQLVLPIQDLLDAFRRRQIRFYSDVIGMSR